MRRDSLERLVIVLAIIVAVLAAVVVFIIRPWNGSDNYVIEIDMEGPEIITLEYGESFTDPGASATCFFTRKPDETIDLDVTVTGAVDTEKVGTYRLYYSASYEGRKAEVSRAVEIVDSVPPVIELDDDGVLVIYPDEPYTGGDFTAYDAYDGDLTDKVQFYLEGRTVVYSVTDSSGNITKVTRAAQPGDETAPRIKLEGEKKMTLNGGTAFQEPGFTAYDANKKDITDQVTVTGAVDVYRPGTYTLKYSVTDENGKTMTAERTVEITPLINDETLSDKVIYLTFDDGPGPHTEKLLAVLEKYNVKATFFVVNTGYEELLKDIHEGGHALAMHSMTHSYSKIYASEDAFFNDLYGIQKIIKDQTGVESMLMRFPGGSSNTVSGFNPGIMSRLVDSVTSKGFHYFDWNVDSNDAGGARSAEQVFANVIAGVEGRTASVVLQHDIHGFSVDAVEKIITWGLANGYCFKALSEDSPACHHGVLN